MTLWGWSFTAKLGGTGFPLVLIVAVLLNMLFVELRTSKAKQSLRRQYADDGTVALSAAPLRDK